ncbi:MAG TPA: hypothetical protein VKA06_05600 [Spirochaetia bacterium]|nr:hypothetical protein [Spirochaetia bacterium]
MITAFRRKRRAVGVSDRELFPQAVRHTQLLSAHAQLAQRDDRPDADGSMAKPPCSTLAQTVSGLPQSARSGLARMVVFPARQPTRRVFGGGPSYA